MKNIFKRSAALLFALVLIVSMLVVPASAGHTHDSNYKEKGRCGTCGEFLPLQDYISNFMPTYYKVADGKTAYMRKYPYMASDDTVGFVYALKAGTKVVVTETVVNGFGNVWQRVWYNGRYGYIVGDKLVPQEGVEPTVFIDGVSAPRGTLSYGYGFNLKGNITSQSKLNNISVYIYDTKAPLGSLGPKQMGPDGGPWEYPLASSNSTTYNMYTGKTNKIRFGDLPKGEYTYVVTAMTSNGVCPWPLVISDFTVK